MIKYSTLEVIKQLNRPLGKKIDQGQVESWARAFWKVAQCKRDSGRPFVMMFPPPNITGNLHLGHAMTASIQDAIVRHRQMMGRLAVFVPGFDHAGLATQSIVERLIWNKHKMTREQIGKEEILKEADNWKDLKRSEMRNQVDKLGVALDYSREYFTMDTNSSQAVQAAFKRLFKQGLIYRCVKPVYWSEEQKSTLSDIEVEHIDGQFRYFRTGEIVCKKDVNQWFIDTREMAHSAVSAIKQSDIHIIPRNYQNSWSSWLTDNGVKDWCISRQSWWGHRIPAYRSKSSPDIHESWVVADSLEEASKLLSTDDVVQDEDVLDTWFSSSLLPLTISGWPDPIKFKASLDDNRFPLDIMETGFDILTYWVSKMAMVSLALENTVPFKLILLHGMVCDGDGKKMSKSKGNVIDPLQVIEGTSLKELKKSTQEMHKNGTLDDEELKSALSNQERLFPRGMPTCGSDGLRSYLLSQDVLEEVVRVQIMQLEKMRRFSNKIWNIYRFLLEEIIPSSGLVKLSDATLSNTDLGNLDEADQKIMRHLNECVLVSYEAFNKTYQLHHSLSSIEYFWSIHLSADYIPAIKSVIKSSSSSFERLVKVRVLSHCIITATKLLHPFMPHTTEFLYQKLKLVLSSECERGEDRFEDLRSLGLEAYPCPQQHNPLNLEKNIS